MKQKRILDTNEIGMIIGATSISKRKTKYIAKYYKQSKDPKYDVVRLRQEFPNAIILDIYDSTSSNGMYKTVSVKFTFPKGKEPRANL